jgi:hydroxymethylbilane synthase
MNELRIATRGSALALWQAEHIRARLLTDDPSLQVSLVVLKTQGDRIVDRPLSQVGGKGLFTKEIEEALLDGRAELAVHSMKDLPAEIPGGLVLGAVPQRADPHDALVLAPRHEDRAQSSSAAARVALLPVGARVGTSSLRRVCQLKRLRPDLEIVPLRGNVDTRLRKLDGEDLDAIVLAAAGLCRLGFGERIAARFTSEEMVPACGQGALGLECRQADRATLQRLARLVDEEAMAAVTAERAFSLRLYGNCQTPLGAHATLHTAESGAQELHMFGMIGSPDGEKLLRAECRGSAAAPAEVGRQLAEQLLLAGADALIQPPAPPVR